MRHESEQQKKEKKANLERSARLKLAAMMKATPKHEQEMKVAPIEVKAYEKRRKTSDEKQIKKKTVKVDSERNHQEKIEATAEIARERHRVAKSAEKLSKLQENQLAHEERETLKLLHREVEENLNREAQEDEALVTAVIEASKKDDDASSEHCSPDTSCYVPLGMNIDEKKTIKLLRETVVKQERRLKITEEIKIPKLLEKAKQKLSQGERKPALYCVAQKRRLERDAENLKNAIFNMETQILLLESAVEDREVAEAMKAAADTLETMHAGIQADDGMDDLTRAINEVSQTMSHDIMLDEEDLLSELQEDYSKEDIKDIIPGGESILSLPSVPSTEMPESSKPGEKQRKSLLAKWF